MKRHRRSLRVAALSAVGAILIIPASLAGQEKSYSILPGSTQADTLRIYSRQHNRILAAEVTDTAPLEAVVPSGERSETALLTEAQKAIGATGYRILADGNLRFLTPAPKLPAPKLCANVAYENDIEKVRAINTFMDSLTDAQKKELQANRFQIPYDHFSQAQRDLLNVFHLHIAPHGSIEINGKKVDMNKCKLTLSFNTSMWIWAKGEQGVYGEIGNTTAQPNLVAETGATK